MIRIAIAGHGNLGRGVEAALQQNPDMELFGIFTRRSPKEIKPLTQGAKVYKLEDAAIYKDEIDVMILCGGSATDLPLQGPELAALFNTVDSFDNHAKINDYFEVMDKAAASTTSIISVGWDPGLFSINRIYFESVLPMGDSYTFWGPGISQGHSDAIRRIAGVESAVQYTIPMEDALEQVRSGRQPKLTTAQKHRRDCYVVAEEGADRARIETEIKTMPNYFAEYDTRVSFISREEFDREHRGMPHGGFVMRTGKTGMHQDSDQSIEFALKLESNPEFTAGVLVAYARAAHRLHMQGDTGAKTVFDIAPAYLSPASGHQLRGTLL